MQLLVIFFNFEITVTWNIQNILYIYIQTFIYVSYLEIAIILSFLVFYVYFHFLFFKFSKHARSQIPLHFLIIELLNKKNQNIDNKMVQNAEN